VFKSMIKALEEVQSPEVVDLALDARRPLGRRGDVGLSGHGWNQVAADVLVVGRIGVFRPEA
jgi:hypothetical protein